MTQLKSLFHILTILKISNTKLQTLTHVKAEILSILKNIFKSEGNPPVIITEPNSNFSITGYPVLIGSRAAKWHVPS